MKSHTLTEAALDIATLTRERDELRGYLERAGWGPCNIAACNCNGWHHVRPSRDESELRARIETLDHELTEAAKDIAKLTKENIRLRDELEQAKADGAEYIARTDPLLACGPSDDPAAGKCGICRACALEQLDVPVEHERQLRTLAKLHDDILEDAEALAKALELIEGIGFDETISEKALAVWRAKHPPAEAKE